MQSPIPMPPENLRFMGKTDEEFLSVGDRQLAGVQSLAKITADDRILDVGCGYGRIAHALLRRGGFSGSYVGMDILPKHVAWCAEELTPFTNGSFQFVHLDVLNNRYNPEGQLTTRDVTFEFAGSASLVMLTSVFTHMYPDGVEHYLNEIARVMQPDGRAVVTFFLQNDSQREAEAAGLSRFPLDYALDPPCRYHNPEDPLHVIAFEEEWVHKAVESAGLRVAEVELGSWCGRRGVSAFQDTLLLTH